MDDVFRALADATRRDLLDRLYREDGQTLRALAADYPMTRIGVMKHLQILEDARLVVTRRRGREKLHFLNPIPIRLVHDRWVSKYAEPWVATLSDIKQQLEQTMEKVFEIYIRTTPERLWEAITDSDIRTKFQFGNRVESTWAPGSEYQVTNPRAGGTLIEGENVEVDPPRRLVQTARRALGRRRGEGRHHTGHVGDRAGGRLVSSHRHPRSAARGRERAALRWLADDPVRPQDLDRNRRDADDAGIVDVRMNKSGGAVMSATQNTIGIRDIRTVGVPVVDQEEALHFYVDTLGFETRLDVPMGSGARWIEVAPKDAATTIALVLAHDGLSAGVETGIRLTTEDADAMHGNFLAQGVDADDVLRWPGTPPMFAFRDHDGNGLEIIEVR